MNHDTDTKVLEREQIDLGQQKKSRISNAPMWIAAAVLVVMAFTVAVAVARMIRQEKPGVMAATYKAHSLARELVEPGPVKAPPKFNHVIFRLGDAEIFRFTYEDGGNGLRYSFEVKEGGT